MGIVHVVYWSGTGNTEAMAKAVAEGAVSAGAEARLRGVGEAEAADLLAAGAIALGCPAMGDEVLEEAEMEPFVASLQAAGLEGKALGLFGSYDWGDGAWMRAWESRIAASGAVLAAPGVVANNLPGDAELESCRALGAVLASKSAG